MKTNTMLEIMTEVAWQVGDNELYKTRAESRWAVVDLALDIINSGLIDDTTDDIDEIITGFLIERGVL
jgi:hypothetical protein